MGLLSFFGSAQVNFKMLQRKTFSIATTELRQLHTIVTTWSHSRNEQHIRVGRERFAITKHSKLFRCDSRSSRFQSADGLQSPKPESFVLRVSIREYLKTARRNS